MGEMQGDLTKMKLQADVPGTPAGVPDAAGENEDEGWMVMDLL